MPRCSGNPSELRLPKASVERRTWPRNNSGTVTTTKIWATRMLITYSRYDKGTVRRQRLNGHRSSTTDWSSVDGLRYSPDLGESRGCIRLRVMSGMGGFNQIHMLEPESDRPRAGKKTLSLVLCLSGKARHILLFGKLLRAFSTKVDAERIDWPRATTSGMVTAKRITGRPACSLPKSAEPVELMAGRQRLNGCGRTMTGQTPRVCLRYSPSLQGNPAGTIEGIQQLSWYIGGSCGMKNMTMDEDEWRRKKEVVDVV